MNDRLADMLTRIRNAVSREKPTVEVPYSGVCLAVCGVLKSEGFIWDVEVQGDEPATKKLAITLKYGPNGEGVLTHLRRVSKPGCRSFIAARKLHRVRRGTGVLVLTTSRGIVSHRVAAKEGVGGEVLAEIW